MIQLSVELSVNFLLELPLLIWSALHQLLELAARKVLGLEYGCLAGCWEITRSGEREIRGRFEEFGENAHRNTHKDEYMEHIYSASLLWVLLLVLFLPSAELVADLSQTITKIRCLVALHLQRTAGI